MTAGTFTAVTSKKAVSWGLTICTLVNMQQSIEEDPVYSADVLANLCLVTYFPVESNLITPTE